jgi:RNA polymerase sigma factor (sigma-70 family)
MDSGGPDFSAVYEEHVQHVYGFFSYRVRGRELAEDLTQATFERALRAWPRYDPVKASARTWLLVIARNLLIDHHRRTHPEPTADIDERMLSSVPGPEDSYSTWAELDTALAELSERDREVLALRFGADMTGPEIAEVLDLTLANVQQITSRALRRLRTLLEASGVARPG